MSDSKTIVGKSADDSGAVVPFELRPKVTFNFLSDKFDGPCRVTTEFGFPLIEVDELPEENFRKATQRARMHGVRVGDWVRIRTPEGAVTFRFGSYQETKQFKKAVAA